MKIIKPARKKTGNRPALQDDKSRQTANELIAYAMKKGKKSGITDVSIAIHSTAKTVIEIERGEISRQVTGQVQSVSVTLFSGDKSLSFTHNSPKIRDIKAAIAQNIEAVQYVPGNPSKALLAKEMIAPPSIEDLDLEDKNPPTLGQMIAYARAIETHARSHPKVQDLRSASINKTESRVLIRATNGIDIARAKTMYYAGATVIASHQDKMETGGSGHSARHFSDMPKPETLGKNAVLSALSKMDSILPDTGTCPIVLDTGAAADFFGSVMAALNGHAVYKGETFFKDALGTQVLPKNVTIIDDPLLKRGLSSQSVDSAGVKAEKLAFVEKGIARQFNVNAFAARKLGLKPIGRENGLTNTRVLPGDQSRDALIADIAHGILVKGFMGGTVDVSGGTFSRQAYGFLIKDGKVTHQAVSGFVVASGNLKKLFKTLAIANDTPEQPHVGGSFAAPTTRLNGATISGR